MIKNFETKLESELKKTLTENVHFNIFANPDKLNASFKGSHLVSQSSGFSGMNMTKKEYDEQGESLFHRKKLYLLN